MHRIRTKLVLSLLVVTLIPLVPSYYLVKGLVNQSIELGFNETVETAIGGAARISGKLYSYYKKETLEVGVQMAASRVVGELLRETEGDEGDHSPEVDRLTELDGWSEDYSIDLYDVQGRLVASVVGEPEESPKEDGDNLTLDIEWDGKMGRQLAEQAMALVQKADSENPIYSYRQRVAELVEKSEPDILEGSEDPLYASVFVPVVRDGQRLGFMVVVRELEEEFVQGARHIVGVNRIFQALDYYKDNIRVGFVIFFVLFYLMIGGLSIGVGYIFSRRITSPLLRLVQGTQTVAEGDLDYRIEVSSRDEIGQLMDSFNKMIASIKENQQRVRQQELERQRAEAENRQRVKDLEVAQLRTRALQAENERKTVELQKSQELERAYQELEESHRQLQEAQAQLILQEKMASLGSMVAGVAHEINNPMGAVHSAVDVAQRCLIRIERGVADRGGDFARSMGILRDNVQVIRQAEERISSLVESLKSFAQLDEAEFQMADLREGLEITMTLLEPQIGAEVEVVREYGQIPQTYCSPGQLNQVFMNVLKNAVQAIDGQGRIEIGTALEEEEIAVRIRDTGVGIPGEKLERIFDLSFSIKSARVRMGSGLSLAYRIVQDHGGEIRIDSEPGKGTEVTIRLPVRQGKEGLIEA